MITKVPEGQRINCLPNSIELPPFLREIRSRLADARRSGRLVIQAGDEGYARAPSNIALLKYWGKAGGGQIQMPVGSSLSRSLDAFHSTTSVRALTRMRGDGQEGLPLVDAEHQFELRDQLGHLVSQSIPRKMTIFLKSFFEEWADDVFVSIKSVNNFPTGCGVASSASGYAALVGALADFSGVREYVSEFEYQRWLVEWARLGSGSATRSAILSASPSHYVAWELESSGNSTQTYEVEAHESFVEYDHLLAVLSVDAKDVSSSEGHVRAHLSPFQGIRVAGLQARFKEICRAVKLGDFERVRQISEEDALLMHAVMATGQPPVEYMTRECRLLIEYFVLKRNAENLRALWTLDAGPNVHFLVHRDERHILEAWLSQQEGVKQVVSGDQMSFHATKDKVAGNHYGLVIGKHVWTREGDSPS